jgi:hypothetical protein
LFTLPPFKMHNSSIKQARPIDNLLQFLSFVNNESVNEKGLFGEGVGEVQVIYEWTLHEERGGKRSFGWIHLVLRLFLLQVSNPFKVFVWF